MRSMKRFLKKKTKNFVTHLKKKKLPEEDCLENLSDDGLMG